MGTKPMFREYINSIGKVLKYLFFGGLTTVINFLTYSLCLMAGIHYIIGNVTAFIVSVIFAYFTNKKWVFNDAATQKSSFYESAIFMGCRILTLTLESIMLYIFIRKMALDQYVVKAVTNIVVVILNYFLSRFVVFGKSKLEIRVFMKKYMKPSIFTVILLFLISGYALFCEPLIGLADNGDFFRVMASNDIKHEADRDINDYFGYFNNKYDKMQYYNELKGKIKSTHDIVLKIALSLDDLFTKDEKFDIRFHALVCLIVLSISLYWMAQTVENMTHNKKLKIILCIMTVFIFGDVGYTSYFNSFYGEAVAYSFYLLSISALLKFVLKEELKIRYLIIFFIATLIFMGSKNQFALNGILAFGLLFALLFTKIGDYRKILSVALGAMLIGATVIFYTAIDDSVYLINKYHMITRGVMLFEPDVQEVTRKIGLNDQYSLLAETIYFDRTPVIHPKDELLVNNFYSQYNIVTVAMYYFTNPDAFSKIMEFGWKNSFTVRPEVLGNYTRSSGREFGERTYFFTAWSYFKDNYIPHTAGLVYIFLVICILLSVNRILKYRQMDRSQTSCFFEIIMLYVFLTGFSQILVSFIGAGDTDLKKHLFMTSVSLDLLLYFNLAYVLSIFFKGHEKKT